MNSKLPISKQSKVLSEKDGINFFKPLTAKMRAEVRFISLILFLWMILIYGFQLLLILVQENALGESILTRFKFIGFPFHYWYTGQLSIIIFIILGAIFSYYIQKIYDKHPKE